jgi:protein-arginine kinase
VTLGGVRLEDVIRSGLCHPDSTVGVYAPDAESYTVFHELFDPILQNFQAPARPHGEDLACLHPAAVVSTRIRVARNLAGHAFAAGMSRPERLAVQAKIVRACGALAPRFPGWITEIADIPSHRLDSMVLRRLAFGPHDKYMAAANIHADWPIGRSVFNTRRKQLSVWINEEDHLRVSVVMPGACVRACAEVMDQVMSCLAAHLDFCVDAQRGHLTSCPTNAGSALRASYMVDMRLDTLQEPQLRMLEAAGAIQIRGAAGEHSPPGGGLVDVGFRNRVGISAEHMLQDLEMLIARNARPH